MSRSSTIYTGLLILGLTAYQSLRSCCDFDPSDSSTSVPLSLIQGALHGYSEETTSGKLAYSAEKMSSWVSISQIICLFSSRNKLQYICGMCCCYPVGYFGGHFLAKLINRFNQSSENNTQV